MQIIYFIFKVDWRCVNKWRVLILRGKGVPSLSHTFTGYFVFEDEQTMGIVDQWILLYGPKYQLKRKTYSFNRGISVSVKCNDNQNVPGNFSPIRVVLDFTIIISHSFLVFCEPKNFVP